MKKLKIKAYEICYHMLCYLEEWVALKADMIGRHYIDLLEPKQVEEYTKLFNKCLQNTLEEIIRFTDGQTEVINDKGGDDNGKSDKSADRL